VNATLDAILQAQQVEDAHGQRHALHSSLSRAECEFLACLVAADPSIRRTLEVGCAFGIASLAICGATAGRDGARHVMIDPFQDTQWHGTGVANLRRAGYDFFELRAEPSEYALPAIAQAASASFDLVLVDGWHTFDHTLLDIFYADRLLRVGGVLVIDDATLASVSKAVAYLERYPGYRACGEAGLGDASWRRALGRGIARSLPASAWSYLAPKKLHDLLRRMRFAPMVAFRKTGEIRRDWSWFAEF
jgi:predicted O-methyltransferase YrrM